MSKIIQYNLEERTLKFSKNVITLLKKIPSTNINKPIISQLIRSATSIGANYQEANGGASKKDFRNKITICKQESKETMYWITLLAHCEDQFKTDLRQLWQEAKELTLIFSRIAISSA